MSLLRDIQNRMDALAVKADYTNVVASFNASINPTVGIWWIFDGNVLAVEENPENCEQGEQICTSKEHSKVWPIVLEQYKDKYPELQNLRYNQVQRGRVWKVVDPSNPTRSQFLITCSGEVAANKEAINRIKSRFGISSQPTRVEAQTALYDRPTVLPILAR